jgi:ADP-dependent NAD(P)H-hydrate dehydratase / NAD(P)H-hydrate epimerase
MNEIKLVTVAEMLEIEREADAAGLSYAQMMDNAGLGLAEVIQDELGYLQEAGILALVGSGNNGGDALVALAHLAEEGWMATAYLVRPRPANDSLVKRLVEVGGIVEKAETEGQFEKLDELLTRHDVLLDGVLGTGIKLPLKAELAQVLEHIRQFIASGDGAGVVVAVDCPSGVDCESGEVAGETIPADLTVTMAAIKQGLLKFPAYNLVGELRLVGIGLPDDLPAWQVVRRFVVDSAWVRERLPERPLDAHKGSFGTAMILAGSLNYTGAAYLAGKAAYRAGSGLVNLAIPSPIHTALAGVFPEATWLLLPNEMGAIAKNALEVVKKNLGKVTSILLGPGFGLEETTRQFLEGLLGDVSQPVMRRKIGFVQAQEGQADQEAEAIRLPQLVVDADGLKLLAQIDDWHDRLPGLTILTPHPGEMAVMTGLTTAEVQADRLALVERYATEWGQVVVLKGAMTLIAAPDGRTALIPVATPALARAGTGDVLSGLIAGMAAQGVEPFEAAVMGAYIHAQAGLTAEERLGNPACVLAGDVLDSVSEVMQELLWQ